METRIEGPVVLWGRQHVLNPVTSFDSIGEAERYVTGTLSGRNRRTMGDGCIEFDIPIAGSETGGTMIIRDKRTTPVDYVVDRHPFVLCGDDLPAIQDGQFVGKGFDTLEEAQGFVERELHGLNLRRESDIIYAFDVSVDGGVVTLFLRDRRLASDFTSESGATSGY